MELVSSAEADAVTPLMSKVYLRLVNAGGDLWEREGVLRFVGVDGEGERLTAWQQLVKTLGVASATARKALAWLHERGAIGYYAGRNGVGIRIFINRAASSVAAQGARRGQKILHFARASAAASRTSPGEVCSKDSFADSDGLDPDLNPRAPEDGADEAVAGSKHSGPVPVRGQPGQPSAAGGGSYFRAPFVEGGDSVDAIVSRLKSELEPCVRAAATQAAAREHERTREWLESRGLPKAARVAQREAFNVLRQHGLVAGGKAAASSAEVGRGNYVAPPPRELSEDEVGEMAAACVAMFETRGQSVDVTLSEMSSEAGGFLLPSDAPRVRAAALALLGGGPKR